MSEDAEAPTIVAYSKADLELKKADLPAFKTFKVGSRVRLVIEGEITSKGEEKVDHEANAAEFGNVELDVKSIRVTGSNEFTDLFQEGE